MKVPRSSLRSASGGHRSSPSPKRPTGRHIPDGDRTVVHLGDLGEFVLEVSRPDPVREHHRVTHAQLGDCLGGTDRVKQLPTRVDGVGDRDHSSSSPAALASSS